MNRNLQSRLLVGIVGVVLILFTILLHVNATMVMFLLFWNLSTFELMHLIQHGNDYRLFMLVLNLIIGMMYLVFYQSTPTYLVLLIWLLAVLYIVLSINMSDWGKSIAYPIYVSIPYCLLIIVRLQPVGALWVTFILLCAWILDIFSYFSGLLFGKHLIAPVISPKKTVEGLAGGLVFSGLFIFFTLRYFTNASLLSIIVIALLLPLTGFLGDLFESLIKRRAGIKDSGDLLAGHGGFLDRFDSILFITILFVFFQQVLHWI